MSFLIVWSKPNPRHPNQRQGLSALFYLFPLLRSLVLLCLNSVLTLSIVLFGPSKGFFMYINPALWSMFLTSSILIPWPCITHSSMYSEVHSISFLASHFGQVVLPVIASSGLSTSNLGFGRSESNDEKVIDAQVEEKSGSFFGVFWKKCKWV